MTSFRRISVSSFASEEFLSSSSKNLAEHVNELNIEIPNFDPFSLFDFKEDESSQWGLVDSLFTSSYPDKDYDGVIGRLPHNSVVFCLTDIPALSLCGSTVVNNQVTKKDPKSPQIGCLYPILDIERKNTLICSAESKSKASKRLVDIFFYGWNNKLEGYEERLLTVQEVDSWSLMQRDVKLFNNHRGGISFNEWVMRASQSKICLIPPGLGINSWRLSELLLNGSFCMLIDPTTQLIFDPPLIDGFHVIHANINSLYSTCLYYLTHPHLIDEISANGYEYAKKYACTPGWEQNIRCQVNARVENNLRPAFKEA